MHGAAFEPDPRLLPGCIDPLRHTFLTQLLDTPEYQSLHAVTRLAAAASTIAAAAFAEQFAALQKDQEGDPGKDKDADESAGEDEGEDKDTEDVAVPGKG